jgi:hypothetical protein
LQVAAAVVAIVNAASSDKSLRANRSAGAGRTSAQARPMPAARLK